MNDLISRQAAIEKIHWLDLDNDTAIKCDLAIRALPSVNTQEPCADAISRQDLLDMAITLRDIANPDKEWEVVTVRTIERLKSVTPKQRTGQWIRHTDASGNSWHACPACGHIAYTLTRFCPDCGKRLEAPS